MSAYEEYEGFDYQEEFRVRITIDDNVAAGELGNYLQDINILYTAFERQSRDEVVSIIGDFVGREASKYFDDEVRAAFLGDLAAMGVLKNITDNTEILAYDEGYPLEIEEVSKENPLDIVIIGSILLIGATAVITNKSGESMEEEDGLRYRVENFYESKIRGGNVVGRGLPRAVGAMNVAPREDEMLSNYHEETTDHDTSMTRDESDRDRFRGYMQAGGT